MESEAESDALNLASVLTISIQNITSKFIKFNSFFKSFSLDSSAEIKILSNFQFVFYPAELQLESFSTECINETWICNLNWKNQIILQSSNLKHWKPRKIFERINLLCNLQHWWVARSFSCWISSILQQKLSETSPIQCQKRRLASVTERNFLCAVIKPSQCHSKSKFSLSSETFLMRLCLIDRISNQSDGNDFFLCTNSTRFRPIKRRTIEIQTVF